MKRSVIIGGAPIQDYGHMREFLREDDFFVCCDSGLNHCAGLGINPDLIVGDFDSHENPGLPVETIELPREKDDTDTVYAVKEMLGRGCREFLLMGVIGGRFDHSMGNISILLMLDSCNAKAAIVDDYSEMEIISDETAYVDDTYEYFSLINISGIAENVTIRNAMYDLENAEISCEYQYAVSNEVLPGKCAEIKVKTGRLLLVKVFPE